MITDQLARPVGTDDQRATTPPGWRRDALRAFVVLSLAIVVVLIDPLTSGGYYTAGDVSELTPLLRTAPRGYQVENPEMTDVGVFVLPYLDWNREELRAGGLPLWNPYNGSGAPHLANGQSRVFSPFSLPFYILPLRAALIVANYATLLVAGMLAYGLARHLGRSHLAGLVAGLGYAFCGGTLVWLHWGISGAAAFAPGMVWAASAAAVADHTRARARAVAGLAVCVALSLVAGHPETTFFGAGTAIVVAGARLAAARRSRREALAGGGAVAGGLALGAAVAGIQLLPLLEYLGQSPGLADHGGGPYHQARNAAVHAFPLVLGAPGEAPRDLVYDLGLPLIENIAPYVGLVLLLLAGVGAVDAVRRREPAGLVFVVGALAWIAYGYDVAGFGGLIGHVPVLDLAYPLRATPLWDLSVVALAAAGIDALHPPGEVAGVDAPGRALDARAAVRRAAPLVGWGAGLLLAGFLAQRHLRSVVPPLHADDAAHVATIARDHMAYVAVTTVAALAAVGVLATTRLQPVRRVAGGVLLVAVFAQTGFMFRHFNPTVDGDLVLPRSAELEAVTELVGDEQTLMLDDTSITPDMNLWYRQRTPFNYDAVGVDAYTRLYRQALRSPEFTIGGGSIELTWLPVDPVSVGALRTLGIRYVTTTNPYPFGEPVAGVQGVEGRFEGDGTVAFDVAFPDDVDVVAVTSPPWSSTCTLRWREPSAEAAGDAVEAPCKDGEAVFSLPPRRRPPVGQAVTVEVRGEGRPDDDQGSSGAPPLLHAYRTDVAGLELMADLGGARVFRVPGTPPRYFSPSATDAAADDDAARAAVARPGFDPAATAVIEDSSDVVHSRGPAPGEVEVLEETSGYVRLRVQRGEPGWLVAQQSAYSGWQATVDGDDAPVRTANAAFIGVPVPEGESTVVLRYRPASVTAGAVISLLAAALVVALVVGTWPVRAAPGTLPRRRRSEPAPEAD